MDIISMIQTLGFPIVALIFLGWFGKDFIIRVMDDSKQRESQLISANKDLTEALRVVADTTENATIQLNRLCDRMDNLEDKIDDLEKKVKI